MNYLTKQPAAGRANNGGLRIGEMERDSILSHCIASFLNESVMERSDKYKVQIDNKTGMISHDGDDGNKKMVKMPHAMKLLIQELESMSVATRLITEDSVNEDIFNELHKNISKYSIEEDFLQEDGIVEEEEE